LEFFKSIKILKYNLDRMTSECTFIDKIRGPKVLNMSIFDWIVSIIIGTFFGLWIGIKTPIKWLIFICIWILLGVLVHYIFGIKTMLGFYLGLNEKPLRRVC